MPNTTSKVMRSNREEEVERLVGQLDATSPQAFTQAIRKIWELMQGCLSENWDEVGRELGARLENMLKILADLRNGTVPSLQEHGYEMNNADQLEKDIKELNAFKNEVLSNWPWSDQELPPVDRTMVAQSRAAICRKEGEPIEVFIRRLGGNPVRED